MKKIVGLTLGVMLLVGSLPAFGMTIFEVSGVIEGTDIANYAFTADEGPFHYVAFLEDQSEAPLTGFDFLFMSITTATENLGSITGPGSVAFDAVPHETYYANIFGTGGGKTQSGMYHIKIVNNVPEPATLFFLLSSVLILVAWRRKEDHGRRAGLSVSALRANLS